MGSFSDVYPAWSDKHKKKVAVKRIRVLLLNQVSFAEFLCRELRLWSELEHPNVLRLLGFFLEGNLSEGIAIPNFVSEWMLNDNLPNYMQKHPLNPHQVCQMISGIISGLQYIHTKRIVHSDFRGSNILISDDGKPLIADFGLSISNTSISLDGWTSHGHKGCLRWMAKELHWNSGASDHHPRHTKETDIWSFGMVICELLTRSKPYPEIGDQQVTSAIAAGHLPKEPDSQDYKVNNAFRALWSIARKCWNPTDSMRPSAELIARDIDFILRGFEPLDRNPTEDGSNWIARTMVGEVLTKHSTRIIFGWPLPNQRLFWVQPSTRTLYWRELMDPNAMEPKEKSALIMSVANTLRGKHELGIDISTSDRVIRVTVPTRESHTIWLTALKHLPPSPVDRNAD